MARRTSRARRHLCEIERRLDDLEHHIHALEVLRATARRSFVVARVAVSQGVAQRSRGALIR